MRPRRNSVMLRSGRQRDRETAPASHGYVKAEFEPVRAAFDSVIHRRNGYGAALCIYMGGDSVVDLWGGTTYRSDSLQLVFSATKGAVAVCASLLAQRGLLDLDAPVDSVWPEFAHAGKGSLP